MELKENKKVIINSAFEAEVIKALQAVYDNRDALSYSDVKNLLRIGRKAI